MSRTLRSTLQDFGLLPESPVILSGPRAFLTGGLLGAGPILLMRGLLLVGVGSWTTISWPILIAIFALPVALFASAFRALPKAKAAATSVSMGALGLALGILFAEFVGYRLRMRAFALATRRAQPIVVAIDRFEERYGRPPEQLLELVPEFLERLPDRIPPLEIQVGDRYPPNEWILEARVGSGFINFDALLYLPHQNYDELFQWEGWVERMGEWGYLHE